jgi:ectoine hydroxylase-related dioxygenase (phytanoyl-CoA dioxygenase family)
MLGLFLQPDAADRLRAMPLHPLVRRHALEVIEKGYTVVRGGIPAATCADIIARFRRFEAANEAIFSAHRNDHGHYPRIVNLHTALPELARLFTRNHIWLAVQDALFGAPTALYTSLFYETGSEQPLHRDTPVFATRPEYLYFGTTVYLEPAGDENGCLDVMEGGHLMPELDRAAMARARYGSLDAVPDLDGVLWDEYQSTVKREGLAKGLSVKRLHVGAGDSLIWHPQLPHGGSPIADRSRTRFSFVMHNTPVGVPVYHQSAFFNPAAPLPEQAPWPYRMVDGRQIADFRHGVSFDHKANYPLERFASPASEAAPTPAPAARVARGATTRLDAIAARSGFHPFEADNGFAWIAEPGPARIKFDAPTGAAILRLKLFALPGIDPGRIAFIVNGAPAATRVRTEGDYWHIVELDAPSLRADGNELALAPSAFLQPHADDGRRLSIAVAWLQLA